MKKWAIILCGVATIFIVTVFSACSDAPLTDDGRGRIRAQGFMLGADISSVISLEDSGVTFYTEAGAESDLFELMAAGGTNWIRVRVWNNPWLDAPGVTGPGGYRRGFGGGNNDVDRAIEIGKRATDAGMRVLVNFHYSDFWADPGKQIAPRAWQGMNIEQKETALYNFTYTTITRMLNEGIDVGMVQIGNETNNGIAGVYAWGGTPSWNWNNIRGWNNMMRLFGAGSRAVINAERSSRGLGPGNFDRQILIAVHKSINTQPNSTDWYAFTRAAQELRRAEVLYDVFGISYYPFWHGTHANLLNLMNHLSGTFNVDVAVFEVSYPFTNLDSDGHGNNWSAWNDPSPPYPLTVAGQADAIRGVTNIVAQVNNNRGVGVFLWEPAWITVGPADAVANRPIWGRYGSGWATTYANSYYSGASSTNHGGSSWDNQAFFTPDGRATANINLFNALRAELQARGRY